MVEKKEVKKIELTPEVANNLFNTEKKRFSAIRKEKRKLERNLLKLDRTVFELDEISASKDNELFVNLGNGVYLESKAIDKKKVKFSVGANVFLDKSITDVVKTLKQKREKLGTNLKQLQQLELQSQDNLNKLYMYLMQQAKQKK